VSELLIIKDLSFVIGGKVILEELNLAIGTQEIHALLGTNGTGKTALARVIMGCEGYAPTAGEIVFDGRVINALPIQERARLGITMAWQEPARFEGLSVRDYLSLGHKDVDPADALAQVGLSADIYLDRMVDKTLSGGERKRVELASALALRPTLAILDEPASGIDLLSVTEIMNVIRSFKAYGASVLLISHQEAIAHIADRASQLCGGKIVFSGEPQAVAAHYKSRRCAVCDGRICPEVPMDG
jgi:Fe-S cluster assembly ATP-binding protein